MKELSPQDKKLLQAIQGEVPLVERPFEALGKRIGLSEAETIDRVRSLKDEAKIIRQIGAIFDTRSLGYKSSLVAMRVDSQRLDQAAAVINEHPGVSHNYRRNHAFNLWFTVAVAPTSRLGLEKTVELMHQLSGADSTRLMPTLKLFKIGVRLDISGDEPATATEEPAYSEKDRRHNGVVTEEEIRVIQVTQEDLPIQERPFTIWEDQLQMSFDQILRVLEGFQERGMMRRYSAVLHHREAGFVANGMGVWVVPEPRIDEVGAKMASFRGVSHCYRRPTYPDWPYTVFTMIHGRTVKDCDAMISAIKEATRIQDYAILYSTKEYKKSRLKYFTSDLADWESRNGVRP